MSGIVGIFNLDGEPVARQLLQQMTLSLAARGPDAQRTWSEGPIGLGHTMLWTTLESLREEQPCSVDGQVWLTADARLDNRVELRRQLVAKDCKALDSDTDAALILYAYEVWGESCVSHLQGDFAFAIWDGRKQQLLCVSDRLGLKPFYYYTNRQVFIWASEFRPLQEAGVTLIPNEGMIGEYLAVAISNPEETLWQGIWRLPPAHVLVVRRDGLRKERYWTLDLLREVHYQSDAEYTEHFLELFTDAVQCRTRSHCPIAVELSGGIDSSSVTAVVHKLAKEGRLGAPDFETFSLVFPGHSLDESPYIQAVVRELGFVANLVVYSPPDVSCYAEQVARYADFPDYPNSFCESLMASVRKQGMRVLLSGQGGDDWLWGGWFYYADLLRHGKIVDVWREICTDYGNNGIAASVLRLLRYGFWPLLPQIVRQLVRRVNRASLPGWIQPQFAHRIRLAERQYRWSKKVMSTAVGFTRREFDRLLNAGSYIHVREVMERAAAAKALEERHPFHDQRLIEFVTALPNMQRRRAGQTRFILRQAMRGIVPEAVRQRSTKAEFSLPFAQVLQALGGETFFASLNLATAKFVDGDEVRRMYRELRRLYAQGQDENLPYIFPLWMVAGLELWWSHK